MSVKLGSSSVNLDLIGLVILCDLKTVEMQTVLAGTSSLLDIFVLCPGLHRQQSAPLLNEGEYPAVAAMTTGYVFRIENPAVVVWLRQVGRTGELTTVDVKPGHSSLSTTTWMGNGLYLLAVVSTLLVCTILVMLGDAWDMAVVLVLVLVRFINVVVIKRRCQTAWKGAAEPGVRGDLLVLLSQDRWIRIQGLVDDLKAVTSGQWLQDMSFCEASVAALGNIMTYFDVALVANMSGIGQVILMLHLILSTGLLALANVLTVSLHMNGRILRVRAQRKKYARRLVMAQELIKVHKRDDWARKMGLIVDSQKEAPQQSVEEVMM